LTGLDLALASRSRRHTIKPGIGETRTDTTVALIGCNYGTGNLCDAFDGIIPVSLSSWRPRANAAQSSGTARIAGGFLPALVRRALLTHSIAER